MRFPDQIWRYLRQICMIYLIILDQICMATFTVMSWYTSPGIHWIQSILIQVCLISHMIVTCFVCFLSVSFVGYAIWQWPSWETFYCLASSKEKTLRTVNTQIILCGWIDWQKYSLFICHTSKKLYILKGNISRTRIIWVFPVVLITRGTNRM